MTTLPIKKKLLSRSFFLFVYRLCSDEFFVSFGIKEVINLRRVGEFNLDHPSLAVGICIDEVSLRIKLFVFLQNRAADRHEEIRYGLDGLNRSENLTVAEFLAHSLDLNENYITQLTLGVDRDSALVAGSFDERNPAVKKLLGEVIAICKRRGKYIGICGQGPSDHADFADWLVERSIDSLSLNPDTVLATWRRLAQA